MLTQERLKQLLTYNPDTGVFIWKVSRGRTKSGNVTGYLNPNGYCYIKVDGKSYQSHRLAFLYMTGEIPEQVDHINREKADNRWCNLRPSTRAENARNRQSKSDSSSKYLGVHWNKPRQKWLDQIQVNGKKTHLGTFTCEKLAAITYNTAALKHHQQFANLNVVEI